MKIARVLFAIGICLALISCGLKNAFFATPPTRTGVEGGATIAGNAAAQHGGFAPETQWKTAERFDWEPTVAADPSSAWVYQMTTPQTPNVLLFRSSADGGATWNASRHICRRVAKLHFQYDPQVVVGRDGTVHVACLDNFKPGVVYAQSHDRGHSWSLPIRLDGHRPYSDKPILLVSPSGRDVYVGFNAAYALYVAASHDAGVTWNRAVLATQRRLWYYPYGGTVAPDGSAWFAVDGETGSKQNRGGSIALVHSADGGVTWTVTPMAWTHEGAPCREKNCYPDFFTGQDAIAADSGGALVFVYAQNDVAQGPNALYVRRSHDGISWSPPFAVAAGSNATSPAIAAGPGAGDFRLVWQDDRNGPKAWNTWYARSTDGGASWSRDVRLSNLGSGAPYKHRGGYDFPFGDYLGLSVSPDGTDQVVWGEGSAIYVPGGTWFTRD
jgi:hypothetical protein